MSLESRIAELETENALLHKQVVEKDSQIAVLEGNQEDGNKYPKWTQRKKCNHDSGICYHPVSAEACHDEKKSWQGQIRPELITVEDPKGELFKGGE